MTWAAGVKILLSVFFSCVYHKVRAIAITTFRRKEKINHKLLKFTIGCGIMKSVFVTMCEGGNQSQEVWHENSL